MKNILLIFILVWIQIAAFAQLNAPYITNYTTKDYGNLSVPEVWSITEDNVGRIYFGLYNEIGIYDGSSFQIIPVASSNNISALEYVESSLYYGGVGQFGRMVQDENNKLKLEVLSNDININFNNIWRIHSSKDFVYFQAEEAIFVYQLSTKEIRTILPKTSFHLSFSVNEEMYVRQRQIGLMSISAFDMKLVNDDFILQEYGIFGGVGLEDDSIFLITRELGFRKINKEGSGKLVDPCQENCQFAINSGIQGATRINKDLIAVNSVTQGCFIIDNNGILLGKVDISNGLNSNEVKDILVDRNNKLWLATGNGISKIEIVQPIQFYDDHFGVDGNVQDIESFKGIRFLSTSLGLLKESDTNSYRFASTALNGQVWDVLNIGDELMFIATFGGIYSSVNGVDFNLMVSGNFNKLFFDETNKLLISGGKNGVQVFDGIGNWSLFSSFEYRNDGVNNIEYDAKNDCFWVGTARNGLIRCQFDGFDMNYTSFGEDRGIKIKLPVKPFKYRNTVVFGTNKKMLRFENESEVEAHMRAAPEWNDTMANYPELFFMGEFYLEKELHTEVHNYSELLHLGDLKIGVVDNELVHLDTNGVWDNKPFSSFDIGRINFMKQEGVYLWIGGPSELVKLNLLECLNYDYNKVTVDLSFTNIVYNDTNRIGTFGRGVIDLKIPFKRNKISFNFGSPTKHNAKACLYKWRLVGDNDEWSSWSIRNQIEFKNLHEGDYRIEIQAKDVFGVLSEVKSFEFEVLTPWYRTFWAYVAYVLFFLLVLYVAIVLGQKRLKAKNERLEEIVAERTSEIREKNTELEHSYHEIAEQKQEITDSINYAVRIQEAILPLSEVISSHISDYFVLFKPKDIVSGDFYWFAHRDDHSIFVCADCTGHGVPGAFMSMIGSDKLNQAVLEKSMTNPADILSWVNVGIKKALKQDEEAEYSSRDGMDVAIVSIDWKNSVLKFAGAHNGLSLIRDGEIIDYKATKVAVAGFTKQSQKYDMQEIAIQKGDAFYMTTDGYPDQFGGIKGKKLKSKIMKNFILSIHQESMQKQGELLENYIMEWMNNEHEQIDDICVVGIRI
ncbi:MAG: serine phosphatase RsbU (regulator of sigma subunit) [Parvicella sp.]